MKFSKINVLIDIKNRKHGSDQWILSVIAMMTNSVQLREEGSNYFPVLQSIREADIFYRKQDLFSWDIMIMQSGFSGFG